MRAMINITEIPMLQSSAIDLCTSLGKKFINHYKRYMIEISLSKNDHDLSHYASEMQDLWDAVQKIKLSGTNKALTAINLIEWFFTTGIHVENYLSSDFVESYNEFIIELLYNRKLSIIEYMNGMRSRQS